MDLKHLTDEALILDTKKLVQNERRLITTLLHYLMEIERRRLFCQFKCQSLQDYAMTELNYSEDAANRRISAMRFMRDFPEVEAKLISGALSMSHLVILRALRLKKELMEQMDFTSTRKALRIISAAYPEALPPEKDQVRPLNETMSEYKFAGAHELEEKLKRLKGLLAHSNPGITTAELINKLCDLGLEQWDPGKSPATPRVRKIYREVWKRAESKCENCRSTYALQVDHIIPVALGGETELSNLRLLCRNCNLRAGIERFGIEKMSEYLRRKSSPPL